MGIEDKSHIVSIVDMGLAKRIFNQETGEHIPFKTGKSLTGTASFASIQAHKGEELSRRDDLEALGYMLIYFVNGSLPWQHTISINKEEKYKEIKRMKMNTPIETLTSGCPKELCTYIKYCRSLSFEQEPDYAYLC